MSTTLWFNGQFLRGEDAHVCASSAGTLLGWGVFTTIGVWNGQPFALPQHLRRLRHDAARVSLELGF
jgi:branched-subunit amino acid aminotransferase/4-amino-4-deoxychorismate lyase